MNESPAHNWQGVPTRYSARWQEIFQSSQEIMNLAAACPVCGHSSLHRWYQVGKSLDRVISGMRFVASGALWEWCSTCRCYEHSSCMVPEWWSCALEVNLSSLTAEPTAIEDALQSGQNPYQGNNADSAAT